MNERKINPEERNILKPRRIYNLGFQYNPPVLGAVGQRGIFNVIIAQTVSLQRFRNPIIKAIKVNNFVNDSSQAYTADTYLEFSSSKLANNTQFTSVPVANVLQDSQLTTQLVVIPKEMPVVPTDIRLTGSDFTMIASFFWDTPTIVAGTLFSSYIVLTIESDI